MIAMQYTIRLANDVDDGEVRERVSQRHRLFDDLPGLVHKSFLYNKTDGLYAPFYVWEGDAPVREFLTGRLFRDLVATFGRPRVRCWTVLAFDDGGRPDDVDVAVKESDSIPAETDIAKLVGEEKSRHAELSKASGLGCHLVGIDPDRWELMRYSTWAEAQVPPGCDADMMQCYQILHLSRPVVTA